MPYVKRNQAGEITAASLEPVPGYIELASDDPELQQFYQRLADAHGRLQQSDLEVIRVLEDLIYLLMDKHIIRFTDLPEAAQRKLSERRTLRKSAQPLDVLDDDTPIL